jgi:hypothetical protein
MKVFQYKTIKAFAEHASIIVHVHLIVIRSLMLLLTDQIIYSKQQLGTKIADEIN